MSGGFTETAFIKKLGDMSNSTQSIQTLSLWLIHHRKHHSTVAKIWFKELNKAKESRKLTFMYLLNDVIQNSRKKGPEYLEEFSPYMTKIFEHIGSTAVDQTKNSLHRMLSIWEERGIYNKDVIEELRKRLNMYEPPPPKKAKTDGKKSDGKKSPVKERKKSDVEKVIENSDGSVETHVHLSPKTPAGDPPEPDELVKAIQDLELNIASSDEVVRERIAKLPREVSEVSLLTKIESREAADKLSTQVEEAVHLLSKYNARLVAEMEHRKKVSGMMRDFVQVQEELLAQAQRTLEEYQEKLVKVFRVRSEIHNHIMNLPDLTQLPNVTDGLAPLPSAEHLFMQ